MLATTTVDAVAEEPSKVALTKAAFVLNFGKYTDWPAHRFAGKDSPLQLCVLNIDSDIGRALLRIDGKPVREREIRVRGVHVDGVMDECHILFVEKDALRKQNAWMTSLAAMPVLTISDAPGFAARGGMIELVPSDARLGFEVNLEATRHAELRLSSQLLALARIVKGK